MTDSALLELMRGYLAAPHGQATPEQTMAWEELYHQYNPSVVRFARKSERQPVDADDLHQEIWKAFAQSLLRLDLDPVRGDLRRWLFGVARRVRGRYTHRGSPRPVHTQDRELRGDRVDPDSMSGNETDRQLMLERVREVILQFAATLPRRNERIVVAYWIEGRSVPQLAGELGISQRCVRSVLHRVLSRLRELLKFECLQL
jgi:RNA polymerase sigma factor (sigma-70 family)